MIELPFPPATLSGHKTRVPIEDRFWKRVDKRGPDECWNWTGEIARDGYGKFWLGMNVSKKLAHRIAWLLTHGEWPGDKCVCHACDNKSCVNPAHLWLGTQADNMADKVAKGRQWRIDQTHCKHGHEFTPENTRFRKGRFGRCCRTCDRVAHAAKQKAVRP